MSDQQRLREALQAAVPEPPLDPWRGSDARSRAQRARRRLVSVGGGVLATVVVIGVAIWIAQSREAAPIVSASGAPACHQVAREVGTERVDDFRVVDGATAAIWLGRVSTQMDAASYRDDHRVTVCLTASGVHYSVSVVAESGRVSLVRSGAWNGKRGVVAAMIALERVRTGGSATTDAPFACPQTSTPNDLDVTSTLPTGATGALLCSDGGGYVPTQPLTTDVDQLVRAVNAGPLGYTPPNFVCSPYAGAYDYTIVFRYPSGTRTATWNPCRGMLLGSFSRGGPMRLDQTYLSLLAGQVGSAHGTPPPPACSTFTGRNPQGVGDVRHVVAARYCPDRSGRPGDALTRGQLALLRTWGRSLMDGESWPDHTCPPPATGWPRLALTDAWGNHFSMLIQGCGRSVFPGVNATSPRHVAHPDGLRTPFLKLARQLGAG